MDIEVRALGPSDEALIIDAAAGVFDHAPLRSLTAEFLHDSRHHLVAALDAGQIVGFVSALHYVHPDKPAELWLNEVSVAPTHQNRGIGQLMLQHVFALGRELGCRCAWVLTNGANAPAMRLYATVGGAQEPSILFEFALAGHDTRTRPAMIESNALLSRLEAPSSPTDERWLSLRGRLWPHSCAAEHLAEMSAMLARGDRVVLALAADGSPLGFAEASIRKDYVNGTRGSPVAFLEGLYVEPAFRRNGVARALVAAVEQWTSARGCTELASDSLIANGNAHAVHRALGFVETERVVFFCKALPSARAPNVGNS